MTFAATKSSMKSMYLDLKMRFTKRRTSIARAPVGMWSIQTVSKGESVVFFHD
jgi:hypothetical protein